MKSINVSIDIMNKALICIEKEYKGLKEYMAHKSRMFLASQKKERKLLPMTPTKRKGNLMIHISLSKALEILSKKGYLKPLEPTLLLIPIPNTWNMNEYCAFRQKLGHKTDNCFRLKHVIQDLIDDGVIAKPRCYS